MPEQPADPRHYEMKIPPEPQQANKESESEKPTADERASEPGRSPDANVSRNDHNEQPPRQSGR